MSKITYKQILSKAKECQANVKKNYKNGISNNWSYYIAKAILKPKTDITKITIDKANNPTGTSISRQILKADFLDICKRYTAYIEKHNQLPNYVTYKDYRIKPYLLNEVLSRILVWYDAHDNKLPSMANINNKIFDKPVETTNEVYDYFVKKFGKFDNTIDGALSKVAGRGYGYYFDDQKSNKQTIDAMATSGHSDDPNCTDTCQVFYNIMLQLIKLGKYKKVEVLHVKCKVSGDGHVRLRITLNDGSKIYRDPAAVIDSGSVTKNWCMDGTLLAVNPNWFMQNLNK